MKQYLLFITLLAAMNMVIGQDLSLFYEVQNGTPTSTVLIKMRNNTVTDMDIGAVNLSIVYRTAGLSGATATYNTINNDLFETEWPGSFLKNIAPTEPLPSNVDYDATEYNARLQYGNTDNDFGAPTYLTLAPGVKTTVMEVVFNTASGSGTFYMEDQGENLLNEIADENILGITYEVLLDGGPFPVEWLKFEAEQMTNSLIHLDWETASEMNNSHFQVERSTDNLVFSKVGRVNGAGTVDFNQQYDFMDSVPQAKTYYYRIKQIDFDGEYQFSETRQVEITKMSVINLNVYPNPASDKINISAQIDQPDGLQLLISDMTGRLILEKKIYGTHDFHLGVDISGLTPGVYNAAIVDGYGQTATSSRFVKK